jgi:hypothetical protein
LPTMKVEKKIIVKMIEDILEMKPWNYLL